MKKKETTTAWSIILIVCIYGQFQFKQQKQNNNTQLNTL